MRPRVDILPLVLCGLGELACSVAEDSAHPTHRSHVSGNLDEHGSACTRVTLTTLFTARIEESMAAHGRGTQDGITTAAHTYGTPETALLTTRASLQNPYP